MSLSEEVRSIAEIGIVNAVKDKGTLLAAADALETIKLHPAEEPPAVNEDGESEYILLFFYNFSVPQIGNYRVDETEGGNYYPGDDVLSCGQYGLFVEGWMHLPKKDWEEQDGV